METFDFNTKENKCEVGGWVRLTNERPYHWNSRGDMDCYLGAVVQIQSISGIDFRIVDQPKWVFRMPDIVEWGADPNTAVRDEHVTQIEDVTKIAEAIFTPERVWGRNSNGTNTIDIHFPKFEITNENGNSHTITDLYVRISYRYYKSAMVPLEFSLSGCRMTGTSAEVESDYCHSHLNCKFGVFAFFCLGVSEFSNIIIELRKNPCKSQWILLFLALINYVVWESLEGGPYRKMENIRSSVNMIPGIEELVIENLIENLPPLDIYSFDGGILSIDGRRLRDFLSKNFTIRNIYKGDQEYENKKAKILTEKNRPQIEWKGGLKTVKITPNIILQEEDENISEDVIGIVENFLKTNFTNYIKNLAHEQEKNKYKETIFSTSFEELCF